MTSSAELIAELTDKDYDIYLDNGIAGELVEFSIFNADSLPDSDGTAVIGFYESVVYTHNHESEHEIFIRSVFERLDPLLSLDFIEGDSAGNSNINIYTEHYRVKRI